MFKMGDKVRFKKDTEFKNGKESVTLAGSDDSPVNLTLICISDEKDGYVDVVAYGIRNAHLRAERLRPERLDDID